MRFSRRLYLAFTILALLSVAACRKAPTVANEVVAVASANIPLDPGNPFWEKVPEYRAALLLQDLVDPRLMKASTGEVLIRAATDGSAITFRMQWVDPRKDDMPGPGLSVDGCAVQIPQTIAKDPVSPQMGEAGRPVQITMWRADWQAWISRKDDSVRDLYPNASIDHYPFQAPPLGTGSADQKEMALLYAPAQALNNRREGPRDSPVEDMIAEGPGTLRPDAGAGSAGKGIRTGDGWQVVVRRRLPAGLIPRARTQVAFAVWEGSQGESGSRKMRTGWIPLLRQGEP